MVNRMLMKARFKRWADSTQYHLSIDDGAVKAAKIMYTRKLRNNFNKLREKVAAIKRAEHINKRLDWFA